MSESWRDPGPWDDSLRHRRSWSTRGRHNLQTPAEFDRQVWLYVENLVAGAASHDRSILTRAMDEALNLPKSRLIGVKRALGIGVWCLVTALVPGPISDESLERLAWRVYPATNHLLNVDTEILTSVLGDGVRLMYADPPSYSVKDGEFILVTTVLLAELLAQAPTSATDLEAVYAECALAFSSTDRASVREAWVSRLPPNG